MGPAAVPYEKLEPLIQDCLCADEDETTAKLIKRLRQARDRGYLKPEELEAICKWKSARAIQLIKSNTVSQIRATTSIALKTRTKGDGLRS